MWPATQPETRNFKIWNSEPGPENFQTRTPARRPGFFFFWLKNQNKFPKNFGFSTGSWNSDPKDKPARKPGLKIFAQKPNWVYGTGHKTRKQRLVGYSCLSWCPILSMMDKAGSVRVPRGKWGCCFSTHVFIIPQIPRKIWSHGIIRRIVWLIWRSRGEQFFSTGACQWEAGLENWTKFQTMIGYILQNFAFLRLC